MKKILLVIICLISLCGCENKQELKPIKDEIDHSQKRLICVCDLDTMSILGYYTSYGYYMHFNKNGSLKSVVKYITYIYKTETEAKEQAKMYKDICYYSEGTRVITCRLDEKIDSEANRGTYELEKAYYENEGYICTTYDNN